MSNNARFYPKPRQYDEGHLPVPRKLIYAKHLSDEIKIFLMSYEAAVFHLRQFDEIDQKLQEFLGWSDEKFKRVSYECLSDDLLSRYLEGGQL